MADREQNHPTPVDPTWRSPDEWFQKSVQYSQSTNNLFKTKYQQRIMELGCQLRNHDIITVEELQEIEWATNTIGAIRGNDIAHSLTEYLRRLR